MTADRAWQQVGERKPILAIIGYSAWPSVSYLAVTLRSQLAHSFNVEVVIDEWVETARELNRPIPEPKGRLKLA